MSRLYEEVKKITVYIIFLIVFIFGLIAAEDFLAPLALAVLLAYMLYPIASFLEKKGVPRILANLVSIIVAILVIVGIVHFFSSQVSIFAEGFPEMKAQAIEKLRKVQTWASNTFDVSNSTVREWAEERINSLSEMNGTLKTIFQATTNTIVETGLMPVYVFFLLYYRNKFYEFIVKMAPENQEQKAGRILKEMNKVTTRYMTGVATVVMILAVVHSVAFHLIGLEYAVLLGIIAALFNFIPYFGTLIGAIFPILYSLVAASGDKTMWLLIYYVIIQFTENNILTPNITGGHVQLNPLITILSLIVGSMVWGIIGMFIVIPFVAMFRILCEHFSYLKPVAFLLSDRGTEKHAISIDKIKSIFKK